MSKVNESISRTAASIPAVHITNTHFRHRSFAVLNLNQELSLAKSLKKHGVRIKLFNICYRS